MMLSFLQKLDSRLREIEKYLALLAGFIAISVMLMVTLDVVMRNVFNRPLLFVYDVVLFSFIGLIALGFPYVQSQNKNVVIEVATTRLPTIFRNILDLIGYVVGLIVIAIVVWQSGLYAWHSFLSGEYSSGLVKIPLWPGKTVLAIGVTFLAIRLALNILLMLFTKLKYPAHEEEETEPGI